MSPNYRYCTSSRCGYTCRRQANGSAADGKTNGYTLVSQSRTVLLEQTQQVLANMMGDAPICNVCGHITIRSGTCYKCLNCGNSLGCS